MPTSGNCTKSFWKRLAIKRQAFQIGCRSNREEPVSVATERKTSEEIALLKFMQKDGVVFELPYDLSFPANDDISEIAAFPVAKHKLPCPVMHAFAEIRIEF